MFAWIDMLSVPRGGIAQNPYLLNILSPFLYPPRILGEISLGEKWEPAMHIRLPLGEENWKHLQTPVKHWMRKQLLALSHPYSNPHMAADPRFKPQLEALLPENTIFFGDIFRQLLLAVLTEHYLQRHAVQRLIFVTEPTAELEGFAAYMARTDTPILLQSPHPSRLEPFCWRMLHEKGLAVSCSRIHPEGWQKNDFVISLHSGVRPLLLKSSGVPGLALFNQQTGLAPALEEKVQQAGLTGNLAALVPMLEYHLFQGLEKIPQKQDLTDGKQWEHLIDYGKKRGLWEAFLDNPKPEFI